MQDAQKRAMKLSLQGDSCLVQEQELICASCWWQEEDTLSFLDQLSG
jgi:hypothetical protein